jgi:PAS domain S-box-containing protein
MKTVIVGGGRGCLAILELLEAGQVRELDIDVACVVDARVDAPAMVFAQERGIHTLTDHRAALSLPDVELVLELTGDNRVLADLYHEIRPGVLVIDHVSARLFWDLIRLERSLREELETRVALEKELTADRERVQHILDSIPDIVLVLDKDKKILQANARFSDTCSASLADAVGRDCRDVLCATGRAPRHGERHCTFDDAVRERSPVSAVIEREGGGQSFWEVTACPQYDEAGELIEVVETHHPVTERVRLRREVEIAGERFRQFIDSANEIISIKDREGRYVVVNPATAALFQMEPSQLIGRAPAELYEADVAEIIRSHDNEVIENRRYATYTERFVIGGREHYLDVTRFPLFDYRGEVDGVCSIARDITQERELQRQLLQSAKLAAVGRLAADVAHEINNPLTGVLAYAESLLDETGAEDPRRADYEVILRESLRCREIVRTLLDFARQEEPDFQMVDLNEVVEKALALVERQANFQDVTVERKMAAEPLRVNADARQLQQIILNLVINANEAVEGEGTITILSGLLPDRARCFATVRDDGPGVDPEVRDRIFEPFFSTKSTSGLGLAVSWGIIQQHGGTLTVGENAAGGADFRVELPVSRGEDGPVSRGAGPGGPDRGRSGPAGGR